jgi:hypothetical protein
MECQISYCQDRPTLGGHRVQNRGFCDRNRGAGGGRLCLMPSPDPELPPSAVLSQLASGRLLVGQHWNPRKAFH